MSLSPFSIYRRGTDTVARFDASDAKSVAGAAQAAADSLRADVDRLLLVTEALWTLLKEKHGHTDDDLVRRIEEIDRQDGLLDGRVKRARAKCPECGRTALGRHVKCLYCGSPLRKKPFGG